MAFVLKEIIKEYKKNNSIKITTNYSSSGKLSNMLKYGARFDIFLSANEKYVDFVCKEIECIKSNIYAKGKLILLSPKYIKIENNLKDIINQSQDIIIANPKLAPYGKASLEVLKYLNLNKKLIKASSISKTMTFILKSKKMGLNAKSIMANLSIHQISQFNIIDINTSFYSPILQKMALLSQNKNANDFYNFILSKKVQGILRKSGFH